MPCHKKHKMFLVYCCISVKEGLYVDTDLQISELKMGNYSKDLYQECEWCCCIFEIEKAFKENEFMCNECYELNKWKTLEKQFPLKYIFYGKKSKYTEFVQTFIDLLQNQFSEKKMLKVEKEKYQKKLLVFI